MRVSNNYRILKMTDYICSPSKHCIAPKLINNSACIDYFSHPGRSELVI